MQRERTISISNLPPPITIPTQMDMSSNQSSFHMSHHEETNFNRFFFTSRIIPQQSEGYYPFHLSAVLTEHETIRHEMVRCRAAIQCLNLHFMNTMSSTHSPLATYSATTDAVWQVLFLESWTVDYFLPALFIIENNRQKFLIPHYQQLGSDTSKVSHGMEELILHLTRIKEQIASSLNTLVFIVKTNARTNNDSSDYIPTTFLDEESTSEYTTSMILQQIRECSDGFDSLERILLPHYDRMEELWPEIIEDKGEIAWEDILNMMMTSNYATNSEQMTILTAATLTCLGCVLDESLRHSVLAHVLHAHYRNQHHQRQNNIHHSSSSSSQMTPTVTSTQTNSNKNMDSQYNPHHGGPDNSAKPNSTNQMLVEDIENDPPNHNRSLHHNSSSGSQSNSLTNHSSSLLLSSQHRHSSDDDHHHHHRGEENLLFSDTFDDTNMNNSTNPNSGHHHQTNSTLFHSNRSNSSRNNNNNNNTNSTSNHSGGRQNTNNSTNNNSNNVVKTGLNAAIASPSTSHSPPVSSYSSASSPMIVGNTSVSLSSVYLQQQAVPSNYHYQQHQHHHHHRNKHQKIIKDETPEEVTERDRFTFMTRAYCNANTREEYMLHYPFAFSEFLLRTWDERYLRYQLLLFSISCGRDLVQALDDWRSGGGGSAGDVLGWCNCCVS